MNTHKMKINGKEYEMTCTSRVGAMYHFETLFGREFNPTEEKYDSLRLYYAILYTDYRAKGEKLDVDFDTFVCMTEEELQELAKFVNDAYQLTPADVEEEKKGEGSKN